MSEHEQMWCGTEAVNQIHARTCDSNRCTRDAEVIWEAQIDSRYSMVIDTRCYFALCGEHDRWYSDQMPNHRSTRRPDLKVGLTGGY